MSPALANFIFEAANLLLLSAALGWLLFKPVRRALDAERERHQQDVDEGERLRQEAEALVIEALAAQQKAGDEIDQRRQQILDAAEREASTLLQEARRTQHSERVALGEELDSMRDAEALALVDTVGQLAAASVRRLLDVLDGPSIDLALIRAACMELEAVATQATGSTEVECARPLDAEARGLLEAALHGTFRERVVAELGAGVRVTTPAGQVDATSTSIARHAGRMVVKEALGSAEASEPEPSHD